MYRLVTETYEVYEAQELFDDILSNSFETDPKELENINSLYHTEYINKNIGLNIKIDNDFHFVLLNKFDENGQLNNVSYFYNNEVSIDNFILIPDIIIDNSPLILPVSIGSPYICEDSIDVLFSGNSYFSFNTETNLYSLFTDCNFDFANKNNIKYNRQKFLKENHNMLLCSKSQNGILRAGIKICDFDNNIIIKDLANFKLLFKKYLANL